ncbi:MAG: hypothetical protein K0U98_11235 [Deltaproteobacteria bacterium]|nr:hypothetical protein [Deltaproteobacteria bacterium]
MAFLAATGYLSFLSFPSVWAQSPGTQAESQRIEALLGEHERARHAHTEDFFFTWGHRDKIEFLLNHPPLESCEYDQQRLRTFAEWRVAQVGGPVLAAQDPEDREMILDAAEDLLAMDPVRLTTILEAGWPGGGGVGAQEFDIIDDDDSVGEDSDEIAIDVNPHEPGHPLLELAQATAMAFLAYPDLDHHWFDFAEFEAAGGDDFLAFLDTLREDYIEDNRDDLEESAEHREARRRLDDLLASHPGELSAALQQQVAALEATLEATHQLTPVQEARLAGELAGFLMADLPGAAAAHPLGPGIYWSADPLRWLGSFHDFDHAGMVCDFRGRGAPGLLVTDLVEPEVRAGLENDIFLPPDAGPFLSLNGTNNVIAPEAYDLATRRSFLVTSIGVNVQTQAPERVFVDRCAIDYGGHLCRWFRVSDLTCQQANQLANSPTLPIMQPFFQHTDPHGVELNELTVRCGDIDLYDFDPQPNPAAEGEAPDE